LTPQEKELAYLRLQIDSSSVVGEKLNIRDAFRIFKHWTSWAILAIQICLGVPLQGVQLFLPVIIKRLGYSTVKTNLYTVAPNVSGAAMLLILAFCSDWTRWRFPFIALGFLFTFIGFIIYAAIDVERDLSVAYFATFMMVWYVKSYFLCSKTPLTVFPGVHRHLRFSLTRGTTTTLPTREDVLCLLVSLSRSPI
jgi:hypothetical protein